MYYTNWNSHAYSTFLKCCNTDSNGREKQLGLQTKLFAEKEGFEPPVRFRTLVFKTSAFDRSATSPIVVLTGFEPATPKLSV